MNLLKRADSYGSTGWQKLFKLELPLAKKTRLWLVLTKQPC